MPNPYEPPGLPVSLTDLPLAKEAPAAPPSLRRSIRSRFALFVVIALNNAVVIWLFALHDTVSYRGDTIHIYDKATAFERLVQSIVVGLPFAVVTFLLVLLIDAVTDYRREKLLARSDLAAEPETEAVR